MKPPRKRKGARWIVIDGQQWSWFRGSTVVETKVPHSYIDTIVFFTRHPDDRQSAIDAFNAQITPVSFQQPELMFYNS